MLRLIRNKEHNIEHENNERTTTDPRIFEIGILLLDNFTGCNASEREQSAVLLQHRDHHDARRRDGIGNVRYLEDEPSGRTG